MTTSIARSSHTASLHDGEIVEDTEPESFFTAPKSDRAKDFLGKILGH